MIDGKKYKELMKDELLNLGDISFKITESHLIIQCDTLDYLFDDIEEEIGDDIEKFYGWGNDIRSYIREKNIFEVVVEKPSNLTLDNLNYRLRVAVHETWICLCEFARGFGIFEEPDDGLLL